MLRRFSISFAVFSMAVDFLIVVISMAGMTLLRPALSRLSFVREMNMVVWLPAVFYVAFPLIWVLIYAVISIYDGKKYYKVADELAGVTLGSVIATVSMAGILYLSVREVSRVFFVSYALTTFLLCIAWRLVARGLFRLRKEPFTHTRRVLVAGDEKTSKTVLDKINLQSFDSNLSVSQFDLSPGADIPRWVQELRTGIEKDKITDLVLAVPYDSLGTISSILPGLDDLAVNIWAAMDFMDLSFADARVEAFSGIPMLDLRATALSQFDQLIKRTFDLVLTCIMLVLTLPIMLVVSLLILIFDGQPMLFHQERVGENGRVFKMHKFRTMVRNAEELQADAGFTDENGNHVHKVRADPRVTPLGRYLRRFSLDELPQLFNVLKGEMSIVGPRPELPALVSQYERWQRKRLTVPPGITGWWQVTGRSDRVMHLHTEDDIYYVQNYSIWLDIRIIIRTIYVVLIGRGSY